uniref:CSON013688 protein n=1 Tax=Culicoides sonorensis TaxID=179676 RepID=A0A336JWB7_CULSO
MHKPKNNNILRNQKYKRTSTFHNHALNRYICREQQSTLFVVRTDILYFNENRVYCNFINIFGIISNSGSQKLFRLMFSVRSNIDNSKLELKLFNSQVSMFEKVLIFAFYACFVLLQLTSSVRADEITYFSPARASKQSYCSDLNAQNSLDIDQAPKLCSIELMRISNE